MAQSDVFVRRRGAGYLLDCQTPVSSRLNTRFVVPLLLCSDVPSLVASLNPIFEVDAQQVVLMPQNAATAPVRELGRTITSLEEHRYVRSNALDMLLSGY